MRVSRPIVCKNRAGHFKAICDSFSRDPEDLVPRLERWLRYHFGEFLPQAKHVLGWRSPGLPLTFRLQKTVPCPECRRELMPRIGDLAVLVEEPNLVDRGRGDYV